MDIHDILDVRTMAPKSKHPAIFQHFDQLKEGEMLVIVNDHDPLPLYYEFHAERPHQFSWQYFENRQDIWKIGITKNGVNKNHVNK